jgi:hypothetical protein
MKDWEKLSLHSSKYSTVFHYHDDKCKIAMYVAHNNMTRYDTPVVAEIQSGEVHSKTGQCYWHTGKLVVGKI